MNAFSHIECSKCGRQSALEWAFTLCPCGAPPLAKYNLFKFSYTDFNKADPGQGVWRYSPWLPPVSPLSLREGNTPLFRIQENGINLYIKDEAHNPTGSFKARGLAVAVAVARHLGAQAVALPSLGNAGSALSAYAREARIPAFVYFPDTTPHSFLKECETFGAKVKLFKGTIAEGYQKMCDEMDRDFGRGNWINLATLREPFRVEGKKTMAYELWEQLEGVVPSAIVFPTGGGTGIVGMAKAFDEMEALGWIGEERPKWVVVQSEGCAPLVRAFQRGAERAEEWEAPQTLALGLCVPRTIGDSLILRAVCQSGGIALAVTDEEALRGAKDLSGRAGIEVCPEGGAGWAGTLRLIREGFFKRGETVVVFNTASAQKYRDLPPPPP